MKNINLMYSAFKDGFEIIGHALAVALSSKIGRFKIVSVAIFAIGLLLLCFNMPYLMTVAIGQNTDIGNMNVFELFLTAVNSGNGKAVYSYFLLGTIVFTLFTPVASNSLLSVYNKTSMVSIRKNDTHKVAESIILQLISVTNLLVFFTMITLSSLFSYVYGYGINIFLISFMVWFLGLTLTSFNGWTVELVLRKYGPWAKFGLIAVWVIITGVFFLVFYTNNMLIYGLTDFFIKGFNSLETMLIILSALIIASLGFIYLAFRMGIYTINNTAPYVSDNVKKINKFAYRKQLALTFKILWRNGNVRAPVLLMSFVTFGTLTFMVHEKGNMLGFVLAAPMVVTMSAAVNFFGILGSGNAWIFTVPNFSKKVVEAVFFYNVLFGVLINTVSIIPSLIMGTTNYEVALSFIICTIVCVNIITLVGIHFSITKPNKYDMHIRGENILSPSKSLTVLMFIVLFGGIPAALLFFYGNLIIQFIAMIAIMIFAMLLVNRYSKLLNSEYYINNIISQTS